MQFNTIINDDIELIFATKLYKLVIYPYMSISHFILVL